MTIEKYAVIGNPIAHSKSPLIHQAFATQLGKQISYERIEAPLDGFVDTVKRLQATGYRGANVTVPFKFEALLYASQAGQIRPMADTARAVNTLIFSANGVEGDNTDGIGLVRDIESNLGVSIKQKKVLILGAGGAAFGILQPLLDAGPAQVVISNRTLAKAEEAANILAALIAKNGSGTQCLALALDALDTAAFDVVINSTSAGLTDSRLPLADTVFAPGSLAYDMMYGRETPFMQQAGAAGARVADGLGMLVEQAAEAFYLWHGQRPETAPVMAALRRA